MSELRIVGRILIDLVDFFYAPGTLLISLAGAGPKIGHTDTCFMILPHMIYGLWLNRQYNSGSKSVLVVVIHVKYLFA